ncbi:MAG: hypothetical protein ACNI27_08890 [Desulfovibrio sp.]
MLIYDKKHFFLGLFMIAIFIALQVLMFTPIFNGKNALKASDDLFNSISKGSTNYFGAMRTEIEQFDKTNFSAALKFDKEKDKAKSYALLDNAGMAVVLTQSEVALTGNLHTVLQKALDDAENLFYNKDKELQDAYGLSGKEAAYVWWKTLKALAKDFERQKLFKEAKQVKTVIKKGMEVGYNYFGIEPVEAKDNIFIISASLIFYVAYTLWWGVAILFFFEGIGLQMTAGSKKEV